MMDMYELKKWWAKNQFDVRQRLLMYQEILMGIEDNVSINEIIKDIHAVNVRKKNAFEIMTKEWVIGAASGMRFSQFAKGWIPDNELFLIASGEEKDKLNESFEELIRIVTEQEELVKSVKSEIFPQIFLFFALSAAIYGFSLKLAPGFKKILPEEKWPEITKMYFSFSDFYVDYGPYLIVIALIFAILAFSSFKVLTGDFREKLDKIAPWSIYKNIQAAHFLIVASGMIKSGIALKDVLKNLDQHSFPYLSWHLNKMLRKLTRGEGEGMSLNTGLLDEDTMDRIANYSKRSGFHKGMLSLGRRASKEMISRIERGASRSGSYINYAIYIYIGFTVAALSEMVSSVISSSM
jgi:type II secretory pathway component PulF